MSVKRLAELFESLPSVSDVRSETGGLQASKSSARRRIPSSADSDDETTTLVSAQDTPRPARFIRHPSPVPSTSTIAPAAVEDYRSSRTNRADDTHKAEDITSGHSTSFMETIENKLSFTSSSSKISLTPQSLNIVNDHVHLLSREGLNSPSSPTIPIVSYTPLPATVVFSRHAAPVYLPELDKYLEKIPSPQFSFPFDQKDYLETHMFPPMDSLAASGESIAQLETNKLTAPSWRSRATIFGMIESLIQSLAGSSYIANYYGMQGLLNTVQIFALILSTIVPVTKQNLNDDWRELLLGTIPNILALNFASTLGQAIIFLFAFMTLAFLFLFYFYRVATRALALSKQEGLLSLPSSGSKHWGLMLSTFILTTVYLPLSTMATHVLVWSDDLWVVSNPYTNSTTSPPVIPSLGPSTEWRDPLDFCWTTTMRKDQVNWAPVIIVLSFLVVVLLTIWFPIFLRRVILSSVPVVDPYTELGRPRDPSGMNREYQRLLERDTNPLNFLYKQYRRGWGAFTSMYLFWKLSALIIVTVISPNNCLFRSLPRGPLAVAQAGFLLVVMLLFFVLQCIWAPCINVVSNANEFTSRLNYVLTALISLLVVLNVPGKDIINGVVLYTVYAGTYGLSFYFSIIDTDIMRRFVKRCTHRIDFSIDIFSPRLDISASSSHTRRRIWQESITILLLTNDECKIPKGQRMQFAEARDYEYPPYLLDFAGSPGERHVENLKILKDVGSFAYSRAVALYNGPDHPLLRHLEEQILKHYIGPDCFWQNKDDTRTSYAGSFGNAWWIPFPPTLVIKYDDGREAVVSGLSNLQTYITQNSSDEVRRKREIRMVLRALDGVQVKWPYEFVQYIGSRVPLCCKGRRYKADSTIWLENCVFHITHNGNLVWQGVQLGSGFLINLDYGKDRYLTGDAIGLTDDLDLTPQLARFLFLNQQQIESQLYHLENVLNSYREHFRKEYEHKYNTLTYRFLEFVYEQPRDPTKLAESSIQFERDLRVRQLMLGSETVFRLAYERMALVSSSPAATWWYIFWDDLWRRNHSTIKGLRTHESNFNPYYPISIAYTPLPRAALEAFLTQRGLLHTKPKSGDFFDAGFLNKLYIRLNDIVFHGKSDAMLFHHGHNLWAQDMSEIDLETQFHPSTVGTGGGTEHDDVHIRARPRYRWETLLDDSLTRQYGKHRRRWFGKLGAWFGITPLWASGIQTEGISLDLKLENGRYVKFSAPNDTSGKRR